MHFKITHSEGTKTSSRSITLLALKPGDDRQSFKAKAVRLLIGK